MSLNSQDGKQPSVAELQNFIRSKQKLELIAIDGRSYEGVLKWFDNDAFCLTRDDGTSITLLKRNILGYGPKS